MPATTYTVLKNQILTKLQAVSKLQESTDNPALVFNGYPSAIIVPSEGESDWETNAEDKRVYSFDVIIYEETKKQGASQAIDSLMDAVDDVLDSFAGDKQLAGISMPTNKTLITVNPVHAGWGEVPDKELIAAIVKLKIIVSTL